MKPPPQFTRRVYKAPPGGWGSSSTTYTGHTGDPLGEEEPSTFASLSVTHPSTTYSDYENGHVEHPRDEYGYPNYRAPGQHTMFDVHHQPAVVDTAYAGRKATHLFPSLLGTAVVESIKAGRGVPEPSSDLSEHSAKVVSHLVERGLVKAPTQEIWDHDEGDYVTSDHVRATNDLDYVDGAQSAYGDHQVNTALMSQGDPNVSEVTREHLAEGRKFVRGMLRANRPARARSQQFEQPGLF